MEKQYYSYNEFTIDSKNLASQIKEFNAEVILCVARGGVTLGHFLSSILDNRNLFSINSISYVKDKQLSTIKIFNKPDLSKYKKVLIVDDIVDSGKTINEVLKLLQKDYPSIEFKTAALFYKRSACIKPDYYIHEATQWIDFFWEVDI